MAGSRRGSVANVMNPQDIWKNSLRKDGPLPVTDELTFEEKFQKKMDQRRRKQNTPKITVSSHMNSMDSEASTYPSPSTHSEPFSDIEMLEKEIMIAKNDMITAYHDKVSHFERKIEIKDQEIDLLRGTIDSLSQSSRSLESTPPPINSDFYSESVYSKQILNKMKEMNFQLQNLSRSVEDVRREKNSSFKSLEISMVGNLAKLKSNTFCCGNFSCTDIQPFKREPSIRQMIDKYHEYPSHFKKEITYEKVGKEKTLRSVGVQAKIKKKKFSSFTEYMKNF